MEDISFSEKNGMYVADFVSKGKCVIQIDNGTTENLIFYWHMPDMEPSYYDQLDIDCLKRVFNLDVPAGMMYVSSVRRRLMRQKWWYCLKRVVMAHP